MNRLIVILYESASPVSGPENWEFYILFLLLLLFAVIRLNYARVLQDTFSSLANQRIARRIIRDENILNRRSTLASMLLFFLTMGFLLSSFPPARELLPVTSNLLAFFLFAALVLVYYVCKIFIVGLLGFFFESAGVAKGYIYTLYAISATVGTLLMPILVLANYQTGVTSEILLQVGVGIVLVAFAYGYILAFDFSLRQFRIPVIYLFLYLCTLEIGPFLVAWRFITDLRV